MSGTLLSASSAFVFKSATTSDLSATAFDAYKVAVCYQDGGNSNSGTCNVMHVGNGFPFTLGADLIFSSVATTVTSVAMLATFQAAVCYYTGSDGVCRVLKRESSPNTALSLPGSEVLPYHLRYHQLEPHYAHPRVVRRRMWRLLRAAPGTIVHKLFACTNAPCVLEHTSCAPRNAAARVRRVHTTTRPPSIVPKVPPRAVGAVDRSHTTAIPTLLTARIGRRAAFWRRCCASTAPCAASARPRRPRT